jgi:hypothetical protein
MNAYCSMLDHNMLAVTVHYPFFSGQILDSYPSRSPDGSGLVILVRPYTMADPSLSLPRGPVT